jgi:hypothetical protein
MPDDCCPARISPSAANIERTALIAEAFRRGGTVRPRSGEHALDGDVEERAEPDTPAGL